MLPPSANTIYTNRQKSGSNKTGKMRHSRNSECRVAGVQDRQPDGLQSGRGVLLETCLQIRPLL